MHTARASAFPQMDPKSITKKFKKWFKFDSNPARIATRKTEFSNAVKKLTHTVVNPVAGNYLKLNPQFIVATAGAADGQVL